MPNVSFGELVVLGVVTMMVVLVTATLAWVVFQAGRSRGKLEGELTARREAEKAQADGSATGGPR